MTTKSPDYKELYEEELECSIVRTRTSIELCYISSPLPNALLKFLASARNLPQRNRKPVFPALAEIRGGPSSFITVECVRKETRAQSRFVH